MTINNQANQVLVGKLGNSPTWYEAGGHYENAHLVNSNPGNLDLGIRHIALFVPETKSVKAPLFNTVIHLANGISLDGAIYRQTTGLGVRLSVAERSFVRDNGETGYTSDVKLPSAIVAQVLRYALTKTVVATRKVETSATAPAYTADELRAIEAYRASQAQAQAPAPTPAPAVASVSANDAITSSLDALGFD